MSYFNKDKLEEIFKTLILLQDECIWQSSLQNLFDVAIYLFVRYGEIPDKLNNEEALIRVSDILQSYDTLFNPEINDIIDTMKGGE